MTVPSPASSVSAFAGQTNEALQLLARLYHRWFLTTAAVSSPSASPPVCSYIFASLRQTLLEASDAADALRRVQSLREEHQAITDADEWAERISQASALLTQIHQAAGAITPLLAGETDGARHLCLRCSQASPPEHSARWFNPRERRWLLTPEIPAARRSVYTRCQRCLQALHPSRCVRLVFAGTSKHPAGCDCRMCNRAGVATLLHLYACDWQTQALQMPHLSPPLAAPSRQQCLDQAITRCWQEGWYILNPEVLPPPPAPIGSPQEA